MSEEMKLTEMAGILNNMVYDATKPDCEDHDWYPRESDDRNCPFCRITKLNRIIAQQAASIEALIEESSN